MRLAWLLLIALTACDEPYDPGLVSGSQATIRWLQASDGTQELVAWVDRPTGLDCTWRDVGDGLWRCLPGGSRSVFLDGACTELGFAGSAPVGWRIVDGTFEAWSLGARRTAMTWGISFGVCAPAGEADVANANERLPDDRFATASIERAGDEDLVAAIRTGSDGSRERLATPIDPHHGFPCEIAMTQDGCWTGSDDDDRHPLEERVVGSGRLRWKVLADPHGDWTSPPRGNYDSELGVDCAFLPLTLGDGRQWCAPIAAFRTAIFRDRHCTIATDGVFATAHAAVMLAYPYGIDGVPEVVRTGPTIAPAWLESGGTCFPLVGAQAWEITEELPVDALVSATETLDP